MVSGSASIHIDFKQTEVGVIPVDWQTKRLDELGKWKGGLTPSTSNKKYWQGDKPWISSGDVKSIFLASTKSKITSLALTDHPTILIPKNSIITVNRSGILQRYFPVALNTIPMAINQDIKALIPNKNINPRFLLFCLIYNGNRVLGSCLKDGTTVESIEFNWLKSFQVAIPPIHEQSKIGQILTDLESLIQDLENLIKKNRNIKLGIMQTLINGKTRLPGFSGEWETIILRDFLKISVTDGPHLTPIFHTKGIPFLSVNNLVNNRVDFSELRYISEDDHIQFSKKCKPERNDILLGKAASVGKVAIIDFDLEVNIWSPLALIRVNDKHDSKFVFYSFQSRAILNQIELLTNSSSQGNIGMGDIESLIFNLPNKNEQEAIAEILSDMDAEITALEKRLEKAKGIKKGMMQQLLSGRIRLVDSSTPQDARV